MVEMKRIASLLVLGMIVFGGVKTAVADVQYSLTIFDVPAAVPNTTSAFGINDSGQIVRFFGSVNLKEAEVAGKAV